MRKYGYQYLKSNGIGIFISFAFYDSTGTEKSKTVKRVLQVLSRQTPFG